MGFMDAITTDTLVTIKHDEYYTLIKEAAKAELIMNAVNCNVPHKYIRETMTGESESGQILEQKILLKDIPDGNIAKIIEEVKAKRIIPDSLNCNTCQHKSEPITAEQILEGRPCDKCEDGSNYQSKEREV